MTIFLWAAAFSALATWIVHTFVGGKFVARPLLADSQLPPASKWLNYFCWHGITVLIVFIGSSFAYRAIIPGSFDIIYAFSTLSGSLSLLSATVAIKGGIMPLRFPSTSLFAVISVFGVLAICTKPATVLPF